MAYSLGWTIPQKGSTGQVDRASAREIGMCHLLTRLPTFYFRTKYGSVNKQDSDST